MADDKHLDETIDEKQEITEEELEDVMGGFHRPRPRPKVNDNDNEDYIRRPL